ncbi:MAG: apolipoprotein N-acyltransferase [Candidatus Omnitrophica bacterium]|nr:apolipoprotein N-acyltransferase [Candidatus Omnitrophota bacterium]
MFQNILSKTLHYLLISPFALCFFSAGLLILAFPPFDLWPLAWIALIPFMTLLDKKKPGKAFKYGYLTGALFFAGMLYWFVHMSTSAEIPWVLAGLAVVALVAYLSLYFGFFALGYVFFMKTNRVRKLFILPSVWVALEFLRDHLFTGFGWCMVGHTQYKILPVIQIADITGVAGISFLVVMGNVFFKEVLVVVYRVWFSRHSDAVQVIKKNLKTPMIIFVSMVCVVLIYGGVKLCFLNFSSEGSVAVIQPNVLQQRKWDPWSWPQILRQLKNLTTQAAQEKPDLIIWPETSFPGYIWEKPEVFEDFRGFVDRLNVPVLVGAITKRGETYYNSAILISEQGKVVKQHDKLHLVPFGEYIPFRKYFPGISQIVPIEDFSSGRRQTLFPFNAQRATRSGTGRESLEAPDAYSMANAESRVFSVLICFEDTISYVARRLTRAGANFLVNITNDAWFLDSKEPLLHLQAAVFRTVENRRTLVRAANTGVSCVVDPWGRMARFVEDGSGKKTAVSGYKIAEIFMNSQKTFYGRFGDIFVWLCFGFIVLAGFLKRKEKY